MGRVPLLQIFRTESTAGGSTLSPNRPAIELPVENTLISTFVFSCLWVLPQDRRLRNTPLDVGTDWIPVSQAHFSALEVTDDLGQTINQIPTPTGAPTISPVEFTI